MPTRPLAALTGGTGFVGSHLAEGLLAAGYRVRALVRRSSEASWLAGLEVDLAGGDIRDPASLAPFVAGAELVVHAAGQTSARSLADYRASNSTGTRNLADAVRTAGNPEAHVILVSSQAAAGPSPDGSPVRPEARGRPVSSYGWSKLEGEDEIRSSGLPFTILRPSAIYGPRETAIRDLFIAASYGFVPLLAGGAGRVQLVYVADVVGAVVAAAARGPRGETLFVAHPEVLDYRLVAETLARLRTPPAHLVPVPAALIRLAGVAVGLFSRFGKGPPVFNDEKATEILQPAWLCDVTPTQAALGNPLTTAFSEGAARTWDWYRSEGWLSGSGPRVRSARLRAVP